MATPAARTTFAAVPPEAADVLRPALPGLADEMIAAISLEVPDYARAMEGTFGQLVRMGVEKGRQTRPDLKIGICGEHGGDPASIAFCHEVGLNYVSCSPFRVPIARVAAAQAQIAHSS